jgi:hypothetical protein
MKLGHILALTGLVLSPAAQAAPDTGLVLHNTGIGQIQTGVGAMAGVKIKLGSEREVKKSEKVKLSLAAGPIMAVPDAKSLDGLRRGEASLIGFELNPGYSTSVNFAGKPVAVHYTKLGAAEKSEQEDDDGKQSTGDKAAWVALVAGGVMLALVGYYIAECGSGRCSE